MHVPQIRPLKRKLNTFLRQFNDCFRRKDTRAHLPVYITGQLSDHREKSVEPIAVKAGVPPRTLQEFLTQLCWDADQMRDRLYELVRTRHAGPHAIGIIDETSFVKRGDKTPGVKRQYCGAVGKTENCTATSTSASPATTSTACSAASCSCPRTGRTIATAVARPASPTTWSSAPSGRSAWSCTTGPSPTACTSTG